MINKIKSLERQTNENMKNIHTETETVELKAEVTTSLHYETKKKQPKDIRESTLIYSVMIHE